MPRSLSHYVHFNGEDGESQENDSSLATCNRAIPVQRLDSDGSPIPWEPWQCSLYLIRNATFAHCSWVFSEISEELGEGWGQELLLTLRKITPHSWIQIILLVCRNIDTALNPSKCFSSVLCSSIAMEFQSSLQLFHLFTCSFSAWNVPQDCPLSLLSSSTEMLLPPERQRQTSLIDKILLDKIVLKYRLPWEFDPNITPDPGTMTFLTSTRFDMYKCCSPVALVTLWDLSEQDHIHPCISSF